MSICDFHAHIYPERIAQRSAESICNYYHLTTTCTGTAENLLMHAGHVGVDYVVMLSVVPKPAQTQTINRSMASHISDHAIGFGGLHPHSKHLREDEEQLVALGCKGIKLHPDYQRVKADDPSYDPIYDFAVQAHLPILVHSGDVNTDFSSPRRVAEMLKRFPEATVIVPHLGGYSEWDEAERYIIGKNCYIDTSSSLWALPPEKSRGLIRRHGAERVLFGTDYPLRTQRQELTLLRGLGLSDDELRLILFENAKRLLKL